MPQPFPVAGWALDRAATTNTGVSYLDVWAGLFNNSAEKTLTLKANPHINIDLPVVNFGTTPGHPFLVAGWATDLAAGNGSDVATVHTDSKSLLAGHTDHAEPFFYSYP